MSKKGEKIGRIEAMHIVACALDVAKKERQFGAGSPEHKQAIELEAKIIQTWRGQLWGRREPQPEFCPHCLNQIK